MPNVVRRAEDNDVTYITYIPRLDGTPGKYCRLDVTVVTCLQDQRSAM